MESGLSIFRWIGPVGKAACLRQFRRDLVEIVRSRFWILGCMIECVVIKWRRGMFGLGYPCLLGSCERGIWIRYETGSIRWLGENPYIQVAMGFHNQKIYSKMQV